MKNYFLSLILCLFACLLATAGEHCDRSFLESTSCGNSNCGVCEYNRQLLQAQEDGQYKFDFEEIKFSDGTVDDVVFIEIFEDGKSIVPRQPYKKWQEHQLEFIKNFEADLARKAAEIAAAPEPESAKPIYRTTAAERGPRLEPAELQARLVGFDASDGVLTAEELERAYNVYATALDEIRTISTAVEAIKIMSSALHTHYQLRGYKPFEEGRWKRWPMQVSRFKWFEQFDLRPIDNPLEPAFQVGYMATPYAVGYTTVPFRVIRAESSKKAGYDIEELGMLAIQVFKDNPRKRVYFRIRTISAYSGKYR